MAWTLVQSGFADFAFDVTLGATPTVGNVVAAGVHFRDTVSNVAPTPGYSVIDGNSTLYAEPSASPSVKINRGSVMLFYRLVVGGDTADLHFVNGGSADVRSIQAMEFAPPSGTAAFDGSTKANGTASSGTFAISSGQATAGSMVIPCSSSDDLFVNIMVGNPATPGAVSPWVRNPSDPGGENPGMAYALTGGGPKTMSWTGTSQIDFSIVGASFKVAGSGVIAVALEWKSPIGDPIPQGWRSTIVSY